MARVSPVSENEMQPSVQVVFERHVKDYNNRINNMKATLAHSLPVFEAYMQWYPLYEEVEKILGKRLACLFAYEISRISTCDLCTAFFRKVIIDAGEQPESLSLTSLQKDVLDFGRSIARHQGHINDCLYDSIAGTYSKQDLVILVGFAGQMIATNIFNNVIETDIDDYLVAYLPVVKYS